MIEQIFECIVCRRRFCGALELQQNACGIGTTDCLTIASRVKQKLQQLIDFIGQFLTHGDPYGTAKSQQFQRRDCLTHPATTHFLPRVTGPDCLTFWVISDGI